MGGPFLRANSGVPGAVDPSPKKASDNIRRIVYAA